MRSNRRFAWMLAGALAALGATGIPSRAENLVCATCNGQSGPGTVQNTGALSAPSLKLGLEVSSFFGQPLLKSKSLVELEVEATQLPQGELRGQLARAQRISPLPNVTDSRLVDPAFRAPMFRVNESGQIEVTPALAPSPDARPWAFGATPALFPALPNG